MKKSLYVFSVGMLMGLLCMLTVFAADGAVYRGDADGNGKVNSADARRILRHAAKIELLDDDVAAICDIDESGKVNSADARIALRISAKIDPMCTTDEKYHAHQYVSIERVEATCTDAGKETFECTICKAISTTTLQPKHMYADATCIAPQTCVICGKTNGAPLGHSTQLGICTRCGEAVTDLLEQADEIADHYNNMIAAYLSFLECSVEDRSSIRNYLNTIDSEARIAMQICGNYADFNQIKYDFGKCVEYVRILQSLNPQAYTPGTSNPYLDNMELLEQHLDNILRCYNENWSEFYYAD